MQEWAAACAQAALPAPATRLVQGQVPGLATGPGVVVMRGPSKGQWQMREKNQTPKALLGLRIQQYLNLGGSVMWVSKLPCCLSHLRWAFRHSSPKVIWLRHLALTPEGQDPARFCPTQPLDCPTGVATSSPDAKSL